MQPLAAVLAPLTLVSLTVLIAPLLLDDLDVLRLEDAVERGPPREGLPFCVRRVPGRERAAGQSPSSCVRAIDFRLSFDQTCSSSAPPCANRSFRSALEYGDYPRARSISANCVFRGCSLFALSAATE
jgi:hypothetical protein